jgi:hypothetical protein
VQPVAQISPYVAKLMSSGVLSVLFLLVRFRLVGVCLRNPLLRGNKSQRVANTSW